MPWVKTVTAEEAPARWGRCSPSLGSTTAGCSRRLNPITLKGEAVRVVDELNRVLRFGPSEVSRERREMIAAFVSALNRCTF